MDRNTVTGLLLIFAITMAWAFYTMPSQEELEQQQVEQARQDSIAAAQVETEPAEGNDTSGSDQSQPATTQETFSEDQDESVTVGGVFGESAYSDTVKTTVRTSRYEIEFTNLGAGPARITLLNHRTWDQKRVQMIKDSSRSAYSLGFLSTQNYNIETNDLLFEPLVDDEVIEVQSGEQAELAYRLSLDEDSELIFTYTFYDDQYSYELDIQVNGMDDYISGRSVDFGWKAPLKLTERDRVQDVQASAAYVYAGGELEKLQLTEEGSNEQRLNGTIDWVSTRNRFFGQYIKPVTDSNSAVMIGSVEGTYGEPGTEHHYEVMIESPISGNNMISYELYSGPLRYYDLTEFDDHAYDVVEIGYALIRWFADPLVRYLIIPFFALGSTFISNYGLLIILFGVIVKLLLFPLTQKSFKSMAAMKELQPQMQEIKEKYKDDPQKQQKETIALYRKAKVNPLGGCLPMLLQFPILITLFFFFQNSMIIRQKSFLWAGDLSAPDYIFNLPFSIPFMGDQIAGFVLLMTAAMFLQTKISGGMSGGGAPSGGPNMKAFTYIMPFMLLFIFNNFAAGLSLYYLVYNVLSVAQQALINKQIHDNKPDELKKVTEKKKKKKSWAKRNK